MLHVLPVAVANERSCVSCSGSGTLERKNESSEEREQRLEKMSGAIKTLLECIGEDPERAGLLKTPNRYAEALMYFTKGYEENIYGNSKRLAEFISN